MHLEGLAARWLHYVDHKLHSATWSELCSWMHERFGGDQHEILVRQLYCIKQTESVQDYIDKFSELVDQLKTYSRSTDSELVDQLKTYSRSTDPLYYTTKFVEGLRADIKSIVIMQRPENLDTTCFLALLLVLQASEHRLPLECRG
jgi:hypothetical protein